MNYSRGFYTAFLIGLILDCIRSVLRLADANPLLLLGLSLSALVSYGFAIFYLFHKRKIRK